MGRRAILALGEFAGVMGVSQYLKAADMGHFLTRRLRLVPAKDDV